MKMRPGNAAANHIADHIEVVDDAVGVLPEADAAGHRQGDSEDLVQWPMVVRIDAAGCSAKLAQELRGRNIGFVITARSTSTIEAAIASTRADPGLWKPARKRPGRRPSRRGAQAADLTEWAGLDGWPKGTRLVVRREPRHPGAQRSLFPSDDWRYCGFLTDQKGDPALLDEQMRKHADVENVIARLKDNGLKRMPFTSINANSAWAALCLLAVTLTHWFQNTSLRGPLSKAAPKRLRWQLWHLPAVVCRSGRRTLLRLPDQHPGARALLAAAHPR